jgi:hypothetical protein
VLACVQPSWAVVGRLVGGLAATDTSWECHSSLLSQPAGCVRFAVPPFRIPATHRVCDVVGQRHCDGGLPTGIRYSGSSSAHMPSVRFTESSSKAAIATVAKPRAVACR